MKILFVSHFDGKYGGAKSLLELLKYIKINKEIECIVVTPVHNEINDFCDKSNIENYSVRYLSSVYGENENKVKVFIKRRLRKIINTLAVYRLKKIIRKIKLDVVHTNSSIIDIGVPLSKYKSAPHIWHLREFGDLDFNFVPYEKDSVLKMNESDSIFIAVSNTVKKAWEKKGLNGNKIRVVYNGISRNERLSSVVRNDSDCRLRIVFLGGISPKKGQELLIEALSFLSYDILENIRIDFIGGGDEKYINYLKNLSEKVTDNVQFLGYMKDAANLLSQYNIGIIASRNEAFGRTTIEYMLNNLCVIASDSGANAEIIQDKRSGLIFKDGDSKDLSQKIKYIYFHLDLIDKYGLKGKKRALDKFSSEKYIYEIVRIYEEVQCEYKKENI